MGDRVDIITLIAERKIEEAMEEGFFQNLPGEGKPLPEDDLANLPPEIRLAARVLRSGGLLPEDATLKGSSAQDLKETAPEEGASLAKIEKLNVALSRVKDPKKPGKARNRDPFPDADPDSLDDAAFPKGGRADKLYSSPYADRILSKLFDKASDLGGKEGEGKEDDGGPGKAGEKRREEGSEG
jgi:hypothetical protein